MEVVPEVLVLVPEVVVEELVLVDVELVLVLVLEEVGVVVLVGVEVLELVEVDVFVVEVVVPVSRHWLCASWATFAARVPRSLCNPGFTDWTLLTALVSAWLALLTAPHCPD
ncbi:MAG TPA: hypothetical protein VIX82_15080 [Solirubrobacteraceae bacterium]